MKITTTIIARDEEDRIAKAIKSVKSFSSEVVVVVDSRTVDKTADIAKASGAKVYKRIFDDFSSQKNFAAKKATGEWIFSLDADELVDKKLSLEIKKTLHTKPEFSAYLIPRRNFILGAEIKHTRWSPDKHVWLWKKGKGTWRGKIHEEVVVRGRIGELASSKIHYQYEDVESFVSMINFYTDIEAEELLEKGRKFSPLFLLFYPARSFFGRFFIKKGFLDGHRGFILSVLMAFYRFLTWAKVWEKQKL